LVAIAILVIEFRHTHTSGPERCSWSRSSLNLVQLFEIVAGLFVTCLGRALSAC
jgi:hypothetical protein